MEEIKDTHGRAFIVDVHLNVTRLGLQAIKDEDYVISFKDRVDSNPRLRIPGTAVKAPYFVELKACSQALLEKLFQG